MTSFSEAWKQAGKPPEDEYEPPSGPHQVTIVEASAFTGRDTRQWAKAVLQITGGADAGRRFDHFMNLNNPTGMRIARESLITYGLNPEQLDDETANIDTLHEAMQQLVGTVAFINITYKNGFKNIRVDGAQTTTSVDTPEPPAKAGFEQAAARDFGEEAPF